MELTDSEEDLTSYDTTSSGKKYRYINKAEISHLFLLATNHKLFQQGDYLDWQIMKLNSLIKADEQLNHGCSVMAILSKNSLKLYKNLLTHNHFITKSSQSKKSKEFLYNSPTSVSGFYLSEGESSLTDNTSSFDVFSERKSFDLDMEKRTLKSGVIVPNSSVHILFTKYNISISVDFSPSMTIVDPETGEVLIDRVYEVIAKLIEMLAQPVRIPETNLEFSPEIRLSIIAQGSLVKPIIALLQDVLLTFENFKEVIKNVKIALENVEETLSHKKSPNANWYHSSFEEIIDDALLPFEFLPQEPSPSLFIITDSIMNMKNLNAGFKKLKEKDISFSIINIVSKKQKSFTYSHIFNQEILEFICKAVDGTLIEYSFFKDIESKSEKRKENKIKMKITNEEDLHIVSQTRSHLIHQAVLFKSSPFNVVDREQVQHHLVYTPQKNSHQHIVEKIKDYKMQGIELESLLKMRIRENFFIEDIQYSNETLEPTNITMKSLFFPSIDIKYLIKLVPYLEKKDSKKGFIFYIEIQVISPPSFHERLIAFKKNYTVENPQNSKEISQQLLDTINAIQVADSATIKLLNLSLSTPKTEISTLISQIPKIKLYTARLPCLILQKFTLRQKKQLGEIVVKKMLLESNKYTESNDNEHDISIIKIIERLGSSMMIKKNLFIKFLQNDDTDEYDSMDYFGFCLIELEKHSSSLTRIKISFFNIPSFAQTEFIEFFTKEIENYENSNEEFQVIHDSMIPRLMKRLPYSNEDTDLYTKNLYKLSPHYVSYLKHESLLWNLKDVEGIFSPLLSLIFTQRSIEGFTLLSFKNSPIFYRTIKVKTQYLNNVKPTGIHKKEISESEIEVLLLYSVHVLHKTKQIITEFFIEPRDSYIEVNNELFDQKEIFKAFKEWFQSVDSNFISSFYTFETIYKESLVNSSTINLLKLQQKTNLEFSLEKIYQKGKTKTLFLNFFSSEEIKNAQSLYEKHNKELYDRFERIILNINKVEVPNQIGLDKKKPDRCFGKIMDEKEKIILLTFLPSLIEESLLLRIHECSQLNLSKLIYDTPPLLKEFFNLEKKEEESIFEDHSDLSSNYISFINDCHSYSFTYGVYKMLQEKTDLDVENSLIPSIEPCVEYMVDIDISEFLEAILTSKGNFFKSRGKGISQSEEMKQGFEQILSKYFTKIPGTDFHFYLKDHSIKNKEGKEGDSKNLSDNEGGINKIQSTDNIQDLNDNTLNDLMDNNSQNSSGSGNWNEKEILKFMDDLHLPVFFRMECVTTTQNSEGEERFPITNIPVEKLAKKEDKKDKIFEDIYDLSQPDDWISTITEKKTLLRLVCITLPPDLLPLASKKFNPTKETLEHLLSHYDPNRFSYCKSKYSNFDYEPTYETDTNNPFLDIQLLPIDIRSAIKNTKKRIQSLISKIILNSLLYTSPTVYTIEKVIHHLRNIPLNTFVKYNLDLNFVDKELGIRLFQKEISKNESPIIKPIGDYYIVLFKSNEKMPYYLFQEKDIDNIKVKIPKEKYKDEELEFPYWIILQMKKSKVKVLFYWPYAISETQKENVISLITNSIKKISKTVNTLILLKEVEETRFCSSFLLASTEKKEVSSIDKILGSKSIFKENEFSCSLVHTLTFPLHKRLEIESALPSIYSSVFKSHIVTNRSNMFIFKEKSGNDIFFIRLRTIKSVTSPRSPETPKQFNYSITTEGTDETFFLKLDISGGKLLALDFYGLKKPSTEILNMIKSNIENKLSVNVLTILSQSIKNNPNFKFTLDDLEFIRPFSKKPNSATLINIPDMIEDHFFFLLLYKQNLLTYLRVLNSYEDKSTPNESKDIITFNPAHFGFIFQDFGSQSISKHLQHEAPGRISVIYFSILNNDGKIVKSFPKQVKTENETFQWEDVEPEPVETKYIENGKIEIETSHGDYTIIRLNQDPPKTKYRLLLEIWIKGQIDIESLVDRIVITCNQSIIDYVMEKAVLHKKTSTTHYIYRKDIVFPFQSMIIQKRQLLMGSSSINEVKKRMFLPVWALRTITQKIQERISFYLKIDPYLFIDIDRGDKIDTYVQLEPKVFSTIIGANDLQITYLASNYEDAKNLSAIANHSHLVNEEENLFLNRHFGILINVTNTEIWLLTYNIKKTIFENLWKKDLEQLLSYTYSRVLLLNTILNQKMGLFNHSNSSSLLEYEEFNKHPTFTINNIDLLIKNNTHYNSPKVSSFVKPSVVNSLDFNNLLRGVYYDVPNEESHDPLLSHGNQFKNIVLQQQAEIEKQNQISGIYNILNRLQDSSNLYSNNLQISDFKTILDNSRLYHYYRTPILFTKEQKETKIHRKLLESFLEQYVKYLESLDVVILAVVDGSKDEKNEQKSYQPSTVYLQKIMKGGVLIIELGFEKPIAYLNIYVSDSSAKKRLQLGERRSSNRKLFLQSVTQLKHALHMNSFVYDFHLKHFIKFIREKEVDYPSFDIIEMLKIFETGTIPYYAKSIMKSHFIDLSSLKEFSKSSLKFIFAQISNYPDYFKVDNLEFRQLDSIIVFNDEISDIDYLQSTILYIENDHTVGLYIIRAEIKTGVSEFIKYDKTNLMNELDQYAKGLEQRVKDLLILGYNHYKIHSLWNAASSFNISPNDFEELKVFIYREPLENLDPSLKVFQNSTIPWNEVFYHLHLIYKEDSGVIKTNNQNINHFLIKTENEMLDIEFHIKENNIKIFLLKKEKHVNKKDSESNLISRFVNICTQLLFKLFIEEMKTKKF